MNKTCSSPVLFTLISHQFRQSQFLSPDVDGDDVEIELGHVEVVGDVQVDLARVQRRQQLRDVVAVVQQVHEGVVVQGQALQDLIAKGLKGGRRVKRALLKNWVPK